MTVPFVRPFSASCSAKSTLAPRPVTSDGLSAARETTGGDVTFPAPAVPPSAALRPATAAMAIAVLRAVLLMLRDIESSVLSEGWGTSDKTGGHHVLAECTFATFAYLSGYCVDV